MSDFHNTKRPFRIGFNTYEFNRLKVKLTFGNTRNEFSSWNSIGERIHGQYTRRVMNVNNFYSRNKSVRLYVKKKFFFFNSDLIVIRTRALQGSFRPSQCTNEKYIGKKDTRIDGRTFRRVRTESPLTNSNRSSDKSLVNKIWNDNLPCTIVRFTRTLLAFAGITCCNVRVYNSFCSATIYYKTATAQYSRVIAKKP